MPGESGQRLALFDLDGTLTRKDTFLEMIRYVHGRHRFYRGMLRLLPYLLLYKMRLISNWRAKEKTLAYFFKDMEVDRFRERCGQFARERFPALLREDALKTLRQLRDGGVDIVVVSASAEDWVMPWCERMGITAIATRLEVKEGKLTGKIAGKNCYGVEKVNRVKQAIDLSGYQAIYGYGDSKGDLPMLELATHAYYKVFHN